MVASARFLVRLVLPALLILTVPLVPTVSTAVMAREVAALSSARKIAPAVARRPAGKRTVRLRISFTSCDGCTIVISGRLRRGAHGLPEHGWTTTRDLKQGSHGDQIVLRTQRRNTRGLTIAVRDPNASREFSAMPLAVMRYADLAPGQLVPDPHYTDHAHACWAGTRRKRAVLHFAMAHVSEVDGYIPAPFLLRGKKTIGPAKATLGQVGLATADQSAYMCV